MLLISDVRARGRDGAALNLAGRLVVPSSTRAILWDMDGVLLDTLSLDFHIVRTLGADLGGSAADISLETIRTHFALDPVLFWRALLEGAGVAISQARFATLLGDYAAARAVAEPAVHEGVVEILVAARAAALRLAVVSNNPEAEVTAMLRTAGLLGRVDLVVGNDRPGVAKKPAPDAYLAAIDEFGLPAHECVVVEDSLLGARAGRDAGCYVVGVATGSCDAAALEASGVVDVCYATFRESSPS